MLEARLVALEQAVRVLQGHAVDQVVAPNFDGLWRNSGSGSACPISATFAPSIGPSSNAGGPMRSTIRSAHGLNEPSSRWMTRDQFDLIKRGEVRRHKMH